MRPLATTILVALAVAACDDGGGPLSSYSLYEGTCPSTGGVDPLPYYQPVIAQAWLETSEGRWQGTTVQVYEETGLNWSCSPGVDYRVLVIE